MSGTEGGLYVLYESASGFGLFEVVDFDEIGSSTTEVQAAVADVSRFGRVVKLKSFQPFTSPANALENINAISEHVVSDDLQSFLEMNLPKVSKKKKSSSKFSLGIIAPPLASAINEALDVPCRSDDIVKEIIRGIRLHFTTYIKELTNGRMEQAQLGLGHSYSRAKVSCTAALADAGGCLSGAAAGRPRACGATDAARAGTRAALLGGRARHRRVIAAASPRRRRGAVGSGRGPCGGSEDDHFPVVLKIR